MSTTRHPMQASLFSSGLAHALPWLLIAALSACDRAPPPAPATPPQAVADAVPQPATSEKTAFAVVEVVTGLEHPWSLAFLPDGAMLVTERPGRLRRIGADGAVSAPIAGLPDIFVDGQAGLLDVVLSPTFAEDGLVYVSFAEPNLRGNKAGTAVARGRLEGDAARGYALRDVEVIYRQEPKLSSGTHVGSRLVFDDAGFLFVTQGENRVAEAAQDLDKLQGKLVRIRPDGSVPDDNPFVGRDGARPEIWSYGHRNMQGAALHPVTRRLWTSEHGPMGGDELNIPEPGRNYGWPVVTHGVDYSGSPVKGSVGQAAEGMTPPHHVWPVSPAVSGMLFYSGKAFPAWKGNLFVGALAKSALIRLELDGDRIVHEERLLTDRHQRIRDVREGPDGAIYLLVDDPNGKVLRLQPATETP
ncbi:PQQ-dependent sugar dehydrogenase [Lysobacter hankyongensis]|uniref:Hydrophobic compound transporter HcuB n=1 Tax=Lysobacter hankyongensis TaxID=1176535 RepID=A0ABP9BZJ9_9GAMM